MPGEVGHPEAAVASRRGRLRTTRVAEQEHRRSRDRLSLRIANESADLDARREHDGRPHALLRPFDAHARRPGGVSLPRHRDFVISLGQSGKREGAVLRRDRIGLPLSAAEDRETRAPPAAARSALDADLRVHYRLRLAVDHAAACREPDLEHELHVLDVLAGLYGETGGARRSETRLRRLDRDAVAGGEPRKLERAVGRRNGGALACAERLGQGAGATASPQSAPQRRLARDSDFGSLDGLLLLVDDPPRDGGRRGERDGDVCRRIGARNDVRNHRRDVPRPRGFHRVAACLESAGAEASAAVRAHRAARRAPVEAKSGVRHREPNSADGLARLFVDHAPADRSGFGEFQGGFRLGRRRDLDAVLARDKHFLPDGLDGSRSRRNARQPVVARSVGSSRGLAADDDRAGRGFSGCVDDGAADGSTGLQHDLIVARRPEHWPNHRDETSGPHFERAWTARRCRDGEHSIGAGLSCRNEDHVARGESASRAEANPSAGNRLVPFVHDFDRGLRRGGRLQIGNFHVVRGVERPDEKGLRKAGSLQAERHGTSRGRGRGLELPIDAGLRLAEHPGVGAGALVGQRFLFATVGDPENPRAGDRVAGVVHHPAGNRAGSGNPGGADQEQQGNRQPLQRIVLHRNPRNEDGLSDSKVTGG